MFAIVSSININKKKINKPKTYFFDLNKKKYKLKKTKKVFCSEIKNLKHKLF